MPRETAFPSIVFWASTTYCASTFPVDQHVDRRSRRSGRPKLRSPDKVGRNRGTSPSELGETKIRSHGFERIRPDHIPWGRPPATGEGRPERPAMVPGGGRHDGSKLVVVKARTEGMGLNAASRTFEVSKNTVIDWERRMGGLKRTLTLYSPAKEAPSVRNIRLPSPSTPRRRGTFQTKTFTPIIARRSTVPCAAETQPFAESRTPTRKVKTAFRESSTCIGWFTISCANILPRSKSLPSPWEFLTERFPGRNSS
jgi:hypothetical protein